jgi:site-specific DNA-methyltransferase (adenine-specific)
MQILNGNNLDLLKTLPDNSVDSVVTDPPYGLSFMNKKWDYDVPSVELWKEVYRVLKHGGHVLSFGGTRTYHRMVVNMEDAGFEIRDQIMWLYGSGFPKSHNISKAIDKIQGAEREVLGVSENWRNSKRDREKFGKMEVRGKNAGLITASVTEQAKKWEGWGTALKPANEPICLARKPLSEKSVAENVLKHGTGGIHIDVCRVGLHGGDDARLGGNGSWKTDKSAKNVYAGGYVGDEIQSSSLGRFPANVIHDGSEEVVDGFFDNTSRFFYCAKPSKSDRNDGCEKLQGKHVAQGNQAQAELKRGNVDFDNGNKHNKVRFSQNFHPTVKPTELMRYLCRLITPPNGIVLDPFMGSGSTGKGAILEGFDFIGMELDPEYVEIAKARIEYAQKEFMENQSQQKLF